MLASPAIGPKLASSELDGTIQMLFGRREVASTCRQFRLPFRKRDPTSAMNDASLLQLYVESPVRASAEEGAAPRRVDHVEPLSADLPCNRGDTHGEHLRRPASGRHGQLAFRTRLRNHQTSGDFESIVASLIVIAPSISV
jgi:hypothetical protein